MQITPDTLFYTAIVSLGLGIIIGLFLFFFGRKKGKRKLGLIGLIVSILSGAIGPIMPILVMLIFIFLIARKEPLGSTSAEPGNDPADEDGSDSAL